MTRSSTVTALAPSREPLDPEWSRATLASILAELPARRPRPSRLPRRALVALGAGALTLTTATAVAVGGPTDVVKRAILDFGKDPNSTAHGIGPLPDPELVAQFTAENGVFAVWVATSSSGVVCYAMSDGEWDGEGSPTKDQLSSYGCGGEIYVGPGRPPEELTRADQLGGFFKDDDGPLVYGVSPYLEAVSVSVQGTGVDRTLPVDPESHGYGAALPEAEHAATVTLTFTDAEGRVLGAKRSTAPIG